MERPAVQFDSFSISLLILRPDAPVLDAAAEAALQDAHLDHLARDGYLLAAGPLSNERYRGLSILNVGPEEAQRLKEADPAVRGGKYSVEVMSWTVPSGAMNFSPARFPHSIAEAQAK
jgi:uncharacterized protein YciI